MKKFKQMKKCDKCGKQSNKEGYSVENNWYDTPDCMQKDWHFDSMNDIL